MSCAGNGYLTENLLNAFPFEDDQCLNWGQGIRPDEAQMALQKCFVDAAIHLSGDSVPANGWPSIGQFSVSGASLSFFISVGSDSIQLTVSASETTFPIVSGKASWGNYIVVLSSEGIREFCESGISPPVTGHSSPLWQDGDYFLRLCAKCLTITPVGLTSLRVYDGVKAKSEGPHFILKNDVSVLPGNNMLLSEPDDENGIVLGAVPGAGMGVINCGCSGKTEKKSPLFSSDGHTRFFNDTCYDLEPSIAKVGSKRIGYLKIHAKCTACCTCSMYESLVNDRLSPLSTAVRQAKSDLTGLLETYESAVKRFNQRLEKPILSDVVLTLSGMPVGSNLGSKLSGSNVKGKMGRCAFTAIVRNASFSTIVASVYSLSGSDKVVEASATWSDASGNPKTQTGDSESALVGKNFEIYPGRSLIVTFVSMKNELVESVSTGGYSGSFSAGISYRTSSGATGSLGILKKSVEV